MCIEKPEAKVSDAVQTINSDPKLLLSFFKHAKLLLWKKSYHAREVIPIIRCKIRPDSIIYSDSFRSYNALDVSEFKHLRINHSKKFAQEKNHINGIENFWNQEKGIYESLMVYQKISLICSSKNVNSGSSTDRQNNYWPHKKWIKICQR